MARDPGLTTLLELDGEILGQKLPYDHRHRNASDKGVPYGFRDAHQLLKDFFEEVDRVLKARQENRP
jgi:hypothetical protein